MGTSVILVPGRNAQSTSYLDRTLFNNIRGNYSSIKNMDLILFIESQYHDITLQPQCMSKSYFPVLKGKGFPIYTTFTKTFCNTLCME